MIRSFRDRDTESLYRDQHVGRRLRGLGQANRVAQRKLLMIDAAVDLLDLRVPPGNRLEALRGDREGQHSIRINDRWRVCFRFHDGGFWDVEVVDYH